MVNREYNWNGCKRLFQMVRELKLKLQAHVLTVSFSYNFISFSIDCWSFLGAVHAPVDLIKLISSIISHSDFFIFIYLLPLIYNFKTFDCFPALIGMNKILERNHRSCYSSQNNVAENETQHACWLESNAKS
ncbi:unnamed protein product [Malus baccata var. baccata]